MYINVQFCRPQWNSFKKLQLREFRSEVLMTSAIEYQTYFFSKHLISFGTGLLLALEEDSKLRKNVNQLLLCTIHISFLNILFHWQVLKKIQSSDRMLIIYFCFIIRRCQLDDSVFKSGLNFANMKCQVV